MRKWEMETMILRLGPHGSGWSPVPLVNFNMMMVTVILMMMVINRMILVLKEIDSHRTRQWQAQQC